MSGANRFGSVVDGLALGMRHGGRVEAGPRIRGGDQTFDPQVCVALGIHLSLSKIFRYAAGHGRSGRRLKDTDLWGKGRGEYDRRRRQDKSITADWVLQDLIDGVKVREVECPKANGLLTKSFDDWALDKGSSSGLPGAFSATSAWHAHQLTTAFSSTTARSLGLYDAQRGRHIQPDRVSFRLLRPR
jgi:hypothetical protein